MADHNIGNNVQVSENEDGEVEITHKESGESVRVNEDGLHSRAHSTEELRNIADHIIGTEDDLKSILENDLSAGESVFIGPGTHEYMNIYPTVDDVTVYGTENTTLLLSGDAETQDVGAVKDNLLVLHGVDGWRFDGVTFDGNSAALSDYDANQEDALNALVLAQSRSVSIENCTIQNTRQNGLRTFGGGDHRIINTQFDTNRTHILAFWGDGQWGDSTEPTTDSVIRDCEFHGTVSDMTAGNPYAVYLSNECDNWTVAGNYVYGEGDLGRGINIFNSDNGVFRDNHIYDVSSRGIAFQGGSSSNNEVLDNYVNAPESRPIEGTADSHDNNRISGNKVVGGTEQHAIDLNAGSGWRITENLIILPDPGDNRGIWIDGTTKVKVMGNELVGCKIGGTADNVLASGNTIDDDGQGLDDAFRIGGSDWQITDNETIGVPILRPSDTIGGRGTRITIGGVGDNGGDDPRTAGDWNGNGREGVVVKWDDAGTIRYEQWDDDNGQWVEIGAA